MRAEATAKAEGAREPLWGTKTRNPETIYAVTVASALLPPEEEALACLASLMCHLDSALLRSVKLIETALQRETVAENTRCQVPRGPARLP